MKKMMSLLMSFLMVFALVAPIKAEEEQVKTYTITINNDQTIHTYEAYKIFNGDLDSTGEILSNITWAEGVSLKEGQTVTIKVTEDGTEKDKTLTTAAQIAQALGENKLSLETLLPKLNLGAADAEDNFEDEKYELTGLTAGYYLVKDKDNTLGDLHDAYTDYIIQVVKDVNVEPKNVYPTVDKQVWDEATDDDKEEDENWGETADHNLNETFQFKLIANLPAETNYDEYHNYEDYTVIFTDTMSAGITFESIASVTVDKQPVTLGTEKTNYQTTATANQAGGSWTLTIQDVLGIEGVNIKDGAEIEVIYNAHLNEAAVIGNNDANKNGVYLKYSNNPNADGELGKTPEDFVWVFTYFVDGTKVDGANANKTLPDAQFVFYKKIGNVKHYVQLNDDNKVTGWTTNIDEAEVIKSVVGGKFNIIGLDHDTYYLEETVAPDGYNLLDAPIEVVISATHEEKANKVNAETYIIKMVEGKEEKVDPSIVLTVENNQGFTLPSTGGMGTTLIYVAGGVLFIGAAVLLITRKRMDEE